MMEAVDAQAASLRDFDAVLTRLDAIVDALPTTEWIHAKIVRDVARAAAPALCLVA